MERPSCANEKLNDMNIPVTPHKGSVNCVSNLVDSKFNQRYDQDGKLGIHVCEPTLDHQGTDTGLGSKHEKQNQGNISSGTNICGESDPLESNLTVHSRWAGSYYTKSVRYS